ncbi:FctA domain-containing protein, partial [Vagococcus carniphilus]|uniref:Spy0128 family protein n=2 Tax=Vagococcus carniphilus TaxID=218144 RepID=UPI00288F299D
ATDGSVNFDEIQYDQVGTYNYTISEVKGNQVGMTYDAHVVTVKVTVEDKDGVLLATAVYEGDQIFNNSYKPSAGKVVLNVNKVLTGKELTAGAFNFELKDEAGKVLQTKSNATDGAVNFDEIQYDQVGAYNYTISEVKGNQAGMSYDAHVVTVKVTVEDKDGVLVATAVYEGDQTFNNSYKPGAGKVVLNVNKVLTGKELTAGAFNFELKDEAGKVLQTKSNATDGSVNFDEIQYDQVGTYNYTISEVKGNQVGMSYDAHVVTVKVTVEDKDGVLVATVVYEGDQTFNNSYKPGAGKVVLNVNKVLTGKELTAGAFNFELKDEAGKVLQTKSNATDGSVNFDEITYDQVGTYNYTISEVKGNQVGMTYDAHVVTVKVTVEDKDGVLVATVVYEGNQTFNNSYKPGAGKVVLNVNKVLTGKELTAGAFNFELKDEAGKVLQTKSNATDGSVNFDEIQYDQVGTYNYTISEVKGNQAGMTYDTHVVTVKVTVEDKDGVLVATAVYEGDQTFNNSYKPVTKIVTENKIPKNGSQNKLPKTGEEKLMFGKYFGLLLIFVSVYILKRKKQFLLNRIDE